MGGCVLRWRAWTVVRCCERRSGKEGKEEKDTKDSLQMTDSSRSAMPTCKCARVPFPILQEEIDKIFRLFDVEGKGHIATALAVLHKKQS